MTKKSDCMVLKFPGFSKNELFYKVSVLIFDEFVEKKFKF